MFVFRNVRFFFLKKTETKTNSNQAFSRFFPFHNIVEVQAWKVEMYHIKKPIQRKNKKLHQYDGSI